MVIDKVLNASGAVKRISAVYQRGEYLYQRKIAMNAWAAFLSSNEFRGTKVVRFCVDALEEAMDHYGVLDLFNSDDGSQFA